MEAGAHGHADAEADEAEGDDHVVRPRRPLGRQRVDVVLHQVVREQHQPNDVAPDVHLRFAHTD